MRINDFDYIFRIMLDKNIKETACAEYDFWQRTYNREKDFYGQEKRENLFSFLVF